MVIFVSKKRGKFVLSRVRDFQDSQLVPFGWDGTNQSESQHLREKRKRLHLFQGAVPGSLAAHMST